MKEYTKKCDYCHEEVSVFESLTEYGKHYHERCYIHKENKELEGYRKKWINGKLTEGDKAEIVDKYNLLQNLKKETTVFKGFAPIQEIQKSTLLKKEKRVLSLPDGTTVIDKEGNPVFIEVEEPAVSMSTKRLRPVVEKIKHPHKPKKHLFAEQILQLSAGEK